MAPVAQRQSALVLHRIGQEYRVVTDHVVPRLLRPGEVLVKTAVIGLNPIDWKAPLYNFGIPRLPFVPGRELTGSVCSVHEHGSAVAEGDRVLVVSTDYRDLRKSACQHYVVALDYNVARMPPHLSAEAGATLGVAFVASALALGVCLGVDFSGILDGPDLLGLVRSADAAQVPEDTRREALAMLDAHERPRPGDWLAIWGGSATSANLAMQLARLAGLRVAVVVDQAKHGAWMSCHPVLEPDLLVDSHDGERAVAVVRACTRGTLRIGLDTRGAESAALLLAALRCERPAADADACPSPPATPTAGPGPMRHLVGLAGLPKDTTPAGVRLHSVPVKLFHEVPAVGRALTSWLERLLAARRIAAPRIAGVGQGLESINECLGRMREGDVSAGKLVVRV